MTQNPRKIRFIHLRGTRSSQPLASSVINGTLYFVTDEGVIERSDGTNWESLSGKLTLNTGTLTDSNPALVINQTWNDATEAFVASQINVTDTNSAQASMLQRWSIAGTPVLDLRKDGQLHFYNPNFVSPTVHERLSFAWSAGTNRFVIGTFIAGGATHRDFGLVSRGVQRVVLGANDFILHSAYTLAWGSSGVDTPDTSLQRSSAAVVQINNTLRVGNIITTALPTSDPGVTGQLWNDSGTVKVS